MKTGKDYDSTIREVSTLLLDSGVASKGDKVVMLTGTPIQKHGEADTIKLFTLGTQ
jgi:pyruvate kinase